MNKEGNSYVNKQFIAEQEHKNQVFAVEALNTLTLIRPNSQKRKLYGKQAASNGKLGARMFGSSLADVFNTPAYDCRAIGPDQKPEFAVTRLCSGPREMEEAPAYPPDQGILVCVSLIPAQVGQWKAVYNGRSVGVTRAVPFATTFIDLNCRMQMWARGPFDYLHYYLSENLLKRIGTDHSMSPAFQLQEAFFIEDPVVAQLTKNILSFVKYGEPLDKLALDQTSTILGAYILQARCGVPKFAAPPRCGLEPWQKLRTEEILYTHLEGNITIHELAAACSLSPSHFARCFKKTFGTSVHQRLIQLRVERAKSLLSETNKTLAEIALSCGFYDQAAFSRAFARIEHVTPSNWRRSNTNYTNGS